MKNKIMAAVITAMVMFALGGCADNSVGENEALFDEGASDSVGVVTANDEVQSMAESMAQSMFESMVEGMEESEVSSAESMVSGSELRTTTVEKTTEAEVTATKDIKQRLEEAKRTTHTFYRLSQDESSTLTIDSEIYPYDSEEIVINVDTEPFSQIETYNYEYLDLANLKNYPNLKRLEIADINSMAGGYIKIINGGCASGLENLEEIKLWNVTWWEEDWLSGISSLKKLTIIRGFEYDGRFLDKLSQVETLYIGSCPIEDLDFINEMSSLTELTVDWAKLSNTSFDGVNENYTVKRLIIGWNSYYFGDEDLLTDIMAVSKFRGLEYLELPVNSYEYYEKQVKELQEKLPACEIRF
ncbi:MAG: hypothetical protein K2N72_10730 [Oscillospiraceae bacterium]|nr:hypothetical protein [Oscillospiraceae bacterium]